jgi:hypothetical protein
VRASGPERFWARWPVRFALGAGLILSGAAHCTFVPLDMSPSFRINDNDGVADIPVDILEPDDPGPPPPPAVAEPQATSEEPASKEKDPAASALHDAGAPRDAAAVADAASAAVDAGATKDTLDGAVAMASVDAGGSGSSGARDPEAMIGAVGSVQADVVAIIVAVNFELIRKHPLAGRLGGLFRAIPQWDEFMNGTTIDPVRDIDWLLIAGPSLVNTAKDTMTLRYSTSDAVADHFIDAVAKKYARGGAFDAGVPGMKATLAHADRAERVILRPQSHVLLVVPPSLAEKMARKVMTARVWPQMKPPGLYANMKFTNPHHAIPDIPDTITELRLRIVPRADNGADVFAEGDTKDSDTAVSAARDVKAAFRSHNNIFVSAMTHGLLDDVEVSSEGPLVKAHLTASMVQIATVLNFVEGFLGVPPPPAPPLR